jgi:hypothetical protein
MHEQGIPVPHPPRPPLTRALCMQYMRDLGYPEPADWSLIQTGSASEPALMVNPDTQVWGDVRPYDARNPPLCRWVDDRKNSGHGSCKTDISWLRSAVSLEKAFFDDALVNYILRFHLQQACYRSTQARFPVPVSRIIIITSAVLLRCLSRCRLPQCARCIGPCGFTDASARQQVVCGRLAPACRYAAHSRKVVLCLPPRS